MKQPIDVLIAERKLALKDVDDEWSKLNEQFRRLLDAMVRLDVEDPEYGRLLACLSEASALRVAVGLRHAAMLTELQELMDAAVRGRSGGVNAGAGTGWVEKGVKK